MGAGMNKGKRRGDRVQGNHCEIEMENKIFHQDRYENMNVNFSESAVQVTYTRKRESRRIFV